MVQFIYYYLQVPILYDRIHKFIRIVYLSSTIRISKKARHILYNLFCIETKLLINAKFNKILI